MAQAARQGESAHFYSSLDEDLVLGEIVEMFVEDMPERLDMMITALEEGDCHEIGRAARQLQGAARGYGFDQLTPYADRLETAVRDDLPEGEIRAALESLIAMCNRIRPGTPRMRGRS